VKQLDIQPGVVNMGNFERSVAVARGCGRQFPVKGSLLVGGARPFATARLEIAGTQPDCSNICSVAAGEKPLLVTSVEKYSVGYTPISLPQRLVVVPNGLVEGG